MRVMSHAHEWVMSCAIFASHSWERESHTRENRSCHTHKLSPVLYDLRITFMRMGITYAWEQIIWHTHEWVMPCTIFASHSWEWESHTQENESCHAHEWVMSCTIYISDSCHTFRLSSRCEINETSHVLPSEDQSRWIHCWSCLFAHFWAARDKSTSRVPYRRRWISHVLTWIDESRCIHRWCYLFAPSWVVRDKPTSHVIKELHIDVIRWVTLDSHLILHFHALRALLSSSWQINESCHISSSINESRRTRLLILHFCALLSSSWQINVPCHISSRYTHLLIFTRVLFTIFWVVRGFEKVYMFRALLDSSWQIHEPCHISSRCTRLLIFLLVHSMLLSSSCIWERLCVSWLFEKFVTD